jgi:uncharacterized RDD family membrane protein YckC
LSTSVSPVNLSPADLSPVDLSSTWKQEVNRRIAAHRSRRSMTAAERDLTREAHVEPGSRAAQAVARVAARYANAPSYNEMLAGEARAAMLAAEAASRAARVAHAAAQQVLDTLEAGLEASGAAESAAAPQERYEGASENYGEQVGRYGRDSADEWAEASAGRAAQGSAESPMRADFEAGAGEAYAVRWEPELPARRQGLAPLRSRQTASLFDSAVEDWPEPQATGAEGFELVEPAQPIYGNLIQFPRELVATRRVRPRRVEGPLAETAGEAQLSIFEVDPGAISIEPEPMHATSETVAAEWSRPANAEPDQNRMDWTRPERSGSDWSGMKLDAHPEMEFAQETDPATHAAPTLEHPSMSRRLLAAVVDGALVAGGFLSLAMLAARNWPVPGLRAMEMGSALGLVLAGAFYLTLFLTLTQATPGMRYAQLRLSTFEGQAPTRAQRQARLVAMLLSVVPAGLGLAWAIFDEDHLTWHDRLSHTYLRRR